MRSWLSCETQKLSFCYILLLHKASQFHCANQYKNILNYVQVSYITVTETTDIVELFLSNPASKDKILLMHMHMYTHKHV